MAKATSGGSGTVVIPASEVSDLVRKATGLPTTFFVTVDKAKMNADGSMQANYTFDTSQTPPPPAAARESTDG
jgi:hypothetical protein